MGAHPKVYGDSVTMRQAGWIGAIQGLCLPFRGFSRSGATISTGMLTGASKERAERFSFALAVVLTPPAVGREVLRLVKASHEADRGGHSDRPARKHDDWTARSLLRILRRPGGAEVAEQLARRGPLVPVRNLLPGSFGGGLRPVSTQATLGEAQSTSPQSFLQDHFAASASRWLRTKSCAVRMWACCSAINWRTGSGRS